jgi:hypothetical protein
MQIENVSKELRIGDKSYLYEGCNEYQRVIYVKVDKQLNIVKELSSKSSLTIYSKDKGDREVQRAIGVLEYLVGRLDSYNNLEYVTHLYGEGK